MSTRDIYNYLKIDERLITGGQPTVDQLRAAAEEGFTAVISLVPGGDLPDEAEIVTGLGLQFHHIPVDWAAPQDSDLAAFERAMQATAHDRTLLHCAANFRVTAFYSLYAQKWLGWSAAQAAEFRDIIWQGSDYPVWTAFIARQQARLAAGRQDP